MRHQQTRKLSYQVAAKVAVSFMSPYVSSPNDDTATSRSELQSDVTHGTLHCVIKEIIQKYPYDGENSE